MAARAWRTVSKGGFGVEDMVTSYLEVFDRAWGDASAGRFVRRRAPLSPLPAEVAGVSVFPVATPHVVPDLGAFPSLEDAEDYDDESGRWRGTPRGSDLRLPGVLRRRSRTFA